MEEKMNNKFHTKFKSTLVKQQSEIKNWNQIILKLEKIFDEIIKN